MFSWLIRLFSAFFGKNQAAETPSFTEISVEAKQIEEQSVLIRPRDIGEKKLNRIRQRNQAEQEGRDRRLLEQHELIGRLCDGIVHQAQQTYHNIIVSLPGHLEIWGSMSGEVKSRLKQMGFGSISVELWPFGGHITKVAIKGNPFAIQNLNALLEIVNQKITDANGSYFYIPEISLHLQKVVREELIRAGWEKIRFEPSPHEKNQMIVYFYPPES